MENIYKWEFSDDKNRGVFWYTIAISIVIGLTIWGILTKQYGLSFIVLLISGISFFIENNSSDKIKVELNNLGIKIGDCFYDYSKIENYCFIYNLDKAILIRLRINKKGIKNIDLKIDNDIYQNLKEILPDFLEESGKIEQSTGEKIINFLKL